MMIDINDHTGNHFQQMSNSKHDTKKYTKMKIAFHKTVLYTNSQEFVVGLMDANTKT